MADRRFRSGSLGSQFGGITTPPTIVQQQPTVTSRRDEARNERPAREQAQSLEGVGVTPGATPTEQRAGGATQFIQPYEDPLSDFILGLRALGGQYAGANPLPMPETQFQLNQPYNPQSSTNPSTIGMPFNYADYEPWQVDRVMSGNQQTMTSGGVGSADQEAAYNQFMMWGQTGDPNLRPGYITPITQQIFGLTPQDMQDIGYIQDGAGGWVRVNLGDTSLTGSGYYGGGYGGSSGRSYRVPSSFRSGYASGLINWRIGL